MGGEFTYPKMVPLVLNHGQMGRQICRLLSRSLRHPAEAEGVGPKSSPT